MACIVFFLYHIHKLLLDYILHSCSPERTQGPTDCCLTFNTRLKTTGKSCFSWDVDRMCSRVVFAGIYLREVGVQFGPHAKEHLRSVLFSEPVLHNSHATVSVKNLSSLKKQDGGPKLSSCAAPILIKGAIFLVKVSIQV